MFKWVGKCRNPFDKEHRTVQTFDETENGRQKRHRHVRSQHITPQMRHSAEAGGGHFLPGPCTPPTEHPTSQSNSLYVPLPLMGVVTPGPPAEESQTRDTSSGFLFLSKRSGHVELCNEEWWFLRCVCGARKPRRAMDGTVSSINAAHHTTSASTESGLCARCREVLFNKDLYH